MTTKFLGSAEQSDLTNGTTSIYARTLSASNFNPSKAVKSDSVGILYSTDLLISDVDNLQAELDARTAVWNRTGTKLIPVTSGDSAGFNKWEPESDGDSMTIDCLDSVADSTLTITNSDGTFDAFLQINASTAVDAILDEDSLVSDSATALATQQSIKKYVDDSISAEDFWDRTGTEIEPKTAGDTLKINKIVPQTANGDLTIDVLDTGADSTLIIQNSDASYKCNCSIDGKLVVNDAAYGSPYAFSVQTSTIQTWIEILNNGGAGKGAFFGMYNDDFELWSYQGGHMNFYTNPVASTGTLRFVIRDDGEVRVESLTANRLISSNADSGLVSVADLTSWIAGTASQVTVTDDTDGTVTLSTPQDIATGSSPTFAGLDITGTAKTDTIQPSTGNADITIDCLDTVADSTLTITNSDGTFDAFLQINASTAVDAILDEDDMTSDSATALATQQSIKKYVDDQIAVENIWNRTVTDIAPVNAGDTLKITNFEPEGASDDYYFGGASTTGDSIIQIDRTAGSDTCAISFQTATSEENKITSTDSTLSFYNTTFAGDVLELTASGSVVCGTSLNSDLITNATANSDIEIDVNDNTNNGVLFVKNTDGTYDANLDVDGTILVDQIQPHTSNGDITIDCLDSATDSALLLVNSNGTYDCRMSINSSSAPSFASLMIYGTVNDFTSIPSIEFVSSEDAYPSLYSHGKEHNSVACICADTYYSQTGAIKSSTSDSNFVMFKDTDEIIWFFDSSVAAGSDVTLNEGFHMNLTTGLIYSIQTYSNDIGTQRPVEITSSGEFGFDGSLRKYKMNIAPIKSADVLYDLEPVIYNRRKKIAGIYTNLPEASSQLFFIADDVEKIDPNLCFYDFYDYHKEPGTSKTKLIPKAEPELAGVNQKAILTLAVKAIQEQRGLLSEQKKTIDRAEARIDDLTLEYEELKAINHLLDTRVKKLESKLNTIIKRLSTL